MQGLSLIKGINQNLTTLTEDSRAALVMSHIPNVVRLFADHRIK